MKLRTEVGGGWGLTNELKVNFKKATSRSQLGSGLIMKLRTEVGGGWGLTNELRVNFKKATPRSISSSTVHRSGSKPQIVKHCCGQDAPDYGRRT